MNIKILVVDDDELSVEFMTLMLNNAGFSVISACNGIEGLEAARQEHPDLILMDMQMPVMNGLQAAQEIAADEFAHDIPVIGISAYATPQSREWAIRMGMAGFLCKPFNNKLFISQISAFLPSGIKRESA